jgi:hypothetical protein
MKRTASPFDQLLGMKPGRLPQSTGITLVVAGQKLSSTRAVPGVAAAAVLGDEDAEALERRRLHAELERVKAAQRYQRERLDPEAMAKRQAWIDAHKAERREYMRRWRAANRERNRELKREWAAHQYRRDPEAGAAKSRAYYAANRERILAEKSAREKRKRAERRATAAAAKQNSINQGSRA